MTCRIMQNANEVDAPKSNVYSDADPAGGNTGSFYYKHIASTKNTSLMRYNGADWIDVTSNPVYKHEKIYKWYRRDYNGNPLDGGAIFATGKVIRVFASDVVQKTIFVCDVENSDGVGTIARTLITIVDISDPIQSDEQPDSPVDGMLWIDTSTNPPALKRYNAEDSKFIAIADFNIVDNTLTTYKNEVNAYKDTIDTFLGSYTTDLNTAIGNASDAVLHLPKQRHNGT